MQLTTSDMFITGRVIQQTDKAMLITTSTDHGSKVTTWLPKSHSKEVINKGILATSFIVNQKANNEKLNLNAFPISDAIRQGFISYSDLM
ncbi:MAG: hypothetical protein EPO24_09330 [Bacteroidetes bacterium]|nr:MAG: hypothetical protein EPO24_09330 [Bacteroidota bacterium]